MLREISAGGVVVRQMEGDWWMAAIELPQEKASAPEKSPASIGPVKSSRRGVRPKTKTVLCLPKGLVDPGEKALDAASREVREETGITTSLVTKLADIKYTYVRTWGDGQRVFKIVTFYLFRYESGQIDDVSDEMRIEVAQARWVRLEEAPKLLAYRGEKEMARKALEYVQAHPELFSARDATM
jgi:8-oxo-dGTP pyrophosphatase MutT (NUDIX family)